MGELAWQIPLGTFTVISLSRFWLAPFWTFRDRVLTLEERIVELERENKQLVSTRAKLEFQYEPAPPYKVTQAPAYYRIGVYNAGPAQARGVEVRLISIGPINPLRQHALPSLLEWKGGGFRRDIDAHQTARELDVLTYAAQYGGLVKGPWFSVTLCIGEPPSLLTILEGHCYTLEIQASASNAEPVSARFNLSAQDGPLVFCRASEADG